MERKIAEKVKYLAQAIVAEPNCPRFGVDGRAPVVLANWSKSCGTSLEDTEALHMNQLHPRASPEIQYNGEGEKKMVKGVSQPEQGLTTTYQIYQHQGMWDFEN